MKVFVTGATGLIGRYLINTLFEQDASVEFIGLTRDIPRAQSLINAPVLWVDEISPETMTGVDVVINLAGEPIADKGWTKIQKTKICESRWQITQSLVDTLAKLDPPPKTFISGSAIGIYGRQNEQALSESFTDFYPEFTHQVCAKWEEIAQQVNPQQVAQLPRVVLLRTGIVLEAKHGALAKMLLPFKLGVGGKIASGEQYMSWIHIQDMVNAILHIMTTPEIKGPVNMVAPKAVPNKIFSQSLAQTISRPCIFTTPAFVLKLMLGELSDLLAYGQNVVPEKLLANKFEFSYPELDSALNDLLNTKA